MASKWSLSTAVLLALIVSGLAISAASAKRQGSASQAASRATLKVAQSKQLGRFLVDGRGRSLYLFLEDKAGRIVCTATYASCTKLWPPFLTSGKPRAGQGVNPRLLGTVRRTKPAGLQVTYNRHPLYFYSSDVKAGQTKGQGFFAAWYVVSPTGRAIK